MRWAKRSKDAFIDRDGYGIFGIQQGSIFEDLRKESADKLKEIDFDGVVNLETFPKPQNPDGKAPEHIEIGLAKMAKKIAGM